MRRGARARGCVIRETEEPREGDARSVPIRKLKEERREEETTHRTTLISSSNPPKVFSSSRFLSKPRH